MRLLLLWLFAASGVRAQVSVLTSRNNLARSGENLRETILTPANVNAEQFGKLFSYAVDGQVYAQPLYVPSLNIPGKGMHNVVYVATEHNTVYAFDADSNTGQNTQPLWQVSLTGPGETTVSAADAMNCAAITPEIGITGTPVIDPAAATLYVVAATKRGASFFHRLHALDITTGAERPFSPVVVDATVPGIGGDFFSPSPVKFLPYFHKNRSGLMLLNGIVYTGWASDCDTRSYHGWLIAFDAQDLHQVAVFNSTPDAHQGALWMGGTAPSADEEGNIYAITGNGKFDANTNGRNLGNTVVKLSSPDLGVADYFTPFNQEHLDEHDIDLGSSGAVLLPDNAGNAAHPHLLASAGKEGRIYLLDRDRLGGFQEDSDSQVVQSIEGAIGPLYGGPAYFNGTLYFAAANDPVKAFGVGDAQIAASPSSQSAHTVTYPGAVPAVSANGTADGIVWLLESGPGGMLHAYDAGNVALELYNSQMNALRDGIGTVMKFAVPTIANGKVYAGTESSVAVFGLLR
jgi:hypothetical protein